MYEDRIMVIAPGLQGALTSTGGVFVIAIFVGSPPNSHLPPRTSHFLVILTWFFPLSQVNLVY